MVHTVNNRRKRFYIKCYSDEHLELDNTEGEMAPPKNVLNSARRIAADDEELDRIEGGTAPSKNVLLNPQQQQPQQREEKQENPD
jgi:hypothetical protein